MVGLPLVQAAPQGAESAVRACSVPRTDPAAPAHTKAPETPAGPTRAPTAHSNTMQSL